MRERIRVQSVLYQTGLSEIWRLMRSVAAAAKLYALGGGGVVEIAFGDSSPGPVLSRAALGDLSAAAVDAGLAACTYVHFDANLGSGGGQNRLATEGDSEFIFVLNPDTYIAPRCLMALTAALEDEGVGVAEARQIPFEHPKVFDLGSGDTAWASGACFMVRRILFEALGGFDAEHFPLYCDDVDFSWRVRLAGKRVVHVPSAVVFHDKRLDVGGGLAASEVEVESGTLARLLLATKWVKPDLVQETMSWIEGDGGPAHRRALGTYKKRLAEGHVPSPIPHAAKVAQFIDGNYARHRY